MSTETCPHGNPLDDAGSMGCPRCNYEDQIRAAPPVEGREPREADSRQAEVSGRPRYRSGIEVVAPLVIEELRAAIKRECDKPSKECDVLHLQGCAYQAMDIIDRLCASRLPSSPIRFMHDGIDGHLIHDGYDERGRERLKFIQMDFGDDERREVERQWHDDEAADSREGK